MMYVFASLLCLDVRLSDDNVGLQAAAMLDTRRYESAWSDTSGSMLYHSAVEMMFNTSTAANGLH